MRNQDLNRLGNLIRHAVQYGLDSADDFVKKARAAKSSEPDIIDMPPPPVLYAPSKGRRIAGILMAIAGFGIGGFLLIWSMVLFLGFAIADMTAFGLGLSAVNLLLTGGCGYLAAKGVSMVRRVNRFHTYMNAIGQEELCNIRQLADRIGKSRNYVVKDVEKMIQNGWFCQGHLDDQKTCLMVTDQIYQQYKALEREKEQHRKEEEERQRKQMLEEDRRKEMASGNLSASEPEPEAEVRKILLQGREYVKKIRRCNDAIPGQLISAKIDLMELLTSKIFERIEQKPEAVSEIRKLMEYYLPITIKLLESYAEMDAQPIGGQNIQSAKKEIEDSLDTINTAFEKLLDSLFQDTAWDVSSDITVLKTMLAQEGLNEDGLHKN